MDLIVSGDVAEILLLSRTQVQRGSMLYVLKKKKSIDGKEICFIELLYFQFSPEIGNNFFSS